MERKITQNRVNAMVQGKGVGTGFAAGGILIMLAIAASQAVYPTFSTRNDAISTLGGAGTATALFWNSAMVVTGLLWIYSTYRLFHKTSILYWAVPFYLAGVGFIVVGLSPWNVSPLPHTIGAQMVFFFGAISCLLAWRLTKGSMGRISLVSGVLSILAYSGGTYGLDSLFGSGGVERLLYYPILLWEIAFGGYLISLGDRPHSVQNLGLETET